MMAAHTMSAASATVHRLLIRRRLPQNLVPHVLFSTRSRSKPTSTSARRTRGTNNTDSSTISKSGSARNPPPSATTAPTTDWREWFRSSDYDDPWSTYHPLHHQTNGSSFSETKRDYQNTLIPSILTGSWTKRRHGMNLEPFRMFDQGLDVEMYEDGIYTTSDVNGTTGTNDESLIVQSAEVKKAEGRMRWMDAQTRFLCRMLDDLYRTGVRRETDRPRTERCHRAIGRLLTMTPENSPKRDEIQLGVVVNGLAQRAGAILQRMEQCSPPALRNKETTTTEPPADDDTLGSNNNFPPSGSYQDVYPDYPQHLSITKFELPTPTRQIYNMVLKSYGKEMGPMHVAQQAEDVVWSMIVRAMQQSPQPKPSGEQPQQSPQSESNDDDNEWSDEANKGRDYLFPSMENWNCVLKCWSRSTDPDRAFHAYSFLLSWMEWNKHCQNNEDLQNKNVVMVEPTMESFHLVLKTCLGVEEVVCRDKMTYKSKEQEIERAREMGSGVAIRLWKELQRLEIALDSTTYQMIIQAVCQSSELPSPSSTKALASLVRIFTQCCEDRLDTPSILDVVRAATIESQFVQLTAKANVKK
ncbi:hypothetical protein ACHAXR_010815 [Thalassiosira sp. AJA248-18]